MTQSDIDRIKTYIAAATPGPWAVVVRARRAVNGASIENEDGCRVAFLSPKADKPIDQKIADGQLIANARTDLPAAIAEIERLRRLCGEAEHIISVRYGGVLDQYAHQHDDWEKDIIKQLQSSK